jgi:hypothetical protein
MTTEQLIARKKKLASSARALITGELGLVAASLNISRALRAMETEAPTGYEIFGQFYEAIPRDIPLGVARLRWPIELLLNFDVRLVSLEAQFRPKLLRASMTLVEAYG